MKSRFDRLNKPARFPRVFYRGSVPGATERISTGDSLWDSYLFASSDIEGARMYGPSIEVIKAGPHARILYEGTLDFRRFAGRARRETMLQWASRIAVAAREAGYHIVHFKRQSDIGTVIMDVSAVERDR